MCVCLVILRWVSLSKLIGLLFKEVFLNLRSFLNCQYKLWKHSFVLKKIISNRSNVNFYHQCCKAEVERKGGLGWRSKAFFSHTGLLLKNQEKCICYWMFRCDRGHRGHQTEWHQFFKVPLQKNGNWDIFDTASQVSFFQTKWINTT